jgi:hypothetical protein
MQTITVKYLGPTNQRGSRFKATHTCGAQSVTLPYDYDLSIAENEWQAAKALIIKLGWHENVSEWVRGTINKRGDAVFVGLYKHEIRSPKE